jgi:hypothetical protein
MGIPPSETPWFAATTYRETELRHAFNMLNTNNLRRSDSGHVSSSSHRTNAPESGVREH